MAATIPDGITPPSLGGNYNLVPDLGLMAEDIQDALTRRANLYVGTGAERTSFSNPFEGMNWQDTDSGLHKYLYTNGAWLRLGERFSSGTSGERTALVGTPVGYTWRDTNGDQEEWWWTGSEWEETAPELGSAAFINVTRSDSGPSGGESGDIHFQMI